MRLGPPEREKGYLAEYISSIARGRENYHIGF